MELIKNGAIVQDLRYKLIKDDLKNFIYTGLNSFHDFPLYSEKDIYSRHLQEFVSATFSYYFYNDKNVRCYPFDVINDFGILRLYVKHCKNLSIPIKIYFIESLRNTPIWNGDIPKMKYLGYEYFNSGGPDIDIPFELDNVEHPEFIEFRNNLNELGMFKDFETVLRFEECRNRLMNENCGIDTDEMDFVPVRVNEIEIDDILF